jgi:hypothetical protein
MVNLTFLQGCLKGTHKHLNSRDDFLQHWDKY